jgi:hypothetical protein
MSLHSAAKAIALERDIAFVTLTTTHPLVLQVHIFPIIMKITN